MNHRLLGTAAAASAIVCAAPAIAQSIRFNVPAQPAATGIPELARQADIQILASQSDIAGKTIHAVQGAMTTEQALRRALQGTGLAFSTADGRTYTLARAQASASAAEPAAEGEAIVVTGTHIRGGPVASPVIQIRQREMREAGQRDLGEVIRSIPINYTGGQNPGARFQTGNSANTNVSGSSALNLRGLGPDATLTLINGRRLAYDADSQAVDVSAIPLAAVSSIQIVPDGASAMYGSDAVAGVANILLRADFEGLATSVQLGTSTRGGAFEHAYEAVGGTRWASGGFMVAAEYEHQHAVRADQRDYTRYVIAPNTLLDAQRHHSGLVTLHQDFGAGITFTVDALYNHRRSRGAEFSDLNFAAATRVENESYALSPTLRLALPNDWTASLNGFLGGNDTHRFDDYFDRIDGENVGTEAFFKNKAHGVELDAEGRLFSLPAGDVRLALGVGYRHNHFERILVGDPIVQGGGRGNYYGFGELALPLVSASNARPLLRELTVTGALRHEEYDRFGGVTTPKLGLVYAPSSDLRLKFSWGRAFKAPTLLQQYRTFAVRLQRPSALGGAGFPADATVLVATGGNPDLEPERAETLSATAEFHPRFLEGLNLSATWFHVDYTGRVVQPLLPPFAALSSPVLAEFIDYNPTDAQQAALIARAPRGLQNTLRVPYNPAKVVAIANGQLINAASQRLHGVDLFGSYRFQAAGGEIGLTAFASWLTSRQRNSASAPVASLAGTNFNPPRFRFRAGITGRFGALTAAGFLNYIGRLDDTTFDPPVRGGDMATVDLTLIWKPPVETGPLRGLEFALSAQNLFDSKPPYLAPFDDTIANYDSTNYSPLGRFLSLTVRKNW
jgi:outer membrane receptor protein involved in Fe transport